MTDREPERVPDALIESVPHASADSVAGWANARSVGVLAPVLAALTGELAHFAQTLGEFALVGHENGQTLLDRET